MSNTKPEVSFSLDQRDPHQGSIGIVDNTGRGLLYFFATPFIAEIPEHTGEQRRDFEAAVRQAAEQHWRELHPQCTEVRSLRINYGYRYRHTLARMTPNNYMAQTHARYLAATGML